MDITQFNKANDIAIRDELIIEDRLNKALIKLSDGIDLNNELGVEDACKQLVNYLFGLDGCYSNIKLLEVTKEGDRAKYSVFLGIMPTKAMIKVGKKDAVGFTLGITSSK
jgi:hypothetical protein